MTSERAREWLCDLSALDPATRGEWWVVADSNCRPTD